MQTILHLVVTALAILLAGFLIPGIEVESFWIGLVAALVLGLLNITIKPILAVLTLPVNILTLGLFSFLLSGLMFYFLNIVPGFSVEGFFAPIFGAIIVAVITALFSPKK